MTISEKHRPADSFWDVLDQERRVREDLESKMESVSRAIELGKRMTALKGHSGYNDMLQAIGGMEAHSNERLLVENEPHVVWRLQGRVQALREVRSIMVNAEKRISELDRNLKILQDRYSAIVRPDGKVKQHGIG